MSKNKTSWIVGIGILILLAILLVVRSGGQPSGPAASPGTQPAKVSDNLIITDWQQPDGCGPAWGQTVVDAAVCYAMQPVNGLFNLDNHASYFADLAASLPTLQNGGAKIVGGNIVATYKLKPHQRWSDGTPITMQDYAFSVKMNLAIGNTFGLNQIKSIQVTDPLTAIVTMNGKYISFVENAYPTFFVPQHYLEKKYKTTNFNALVAQYQNDLYNLPSDVFSGPYKIKSWAKDDSSVVLEQNPYYTTQSSSHPRYKYITYVTVGSSASGLTTDLRSPRIHVNKAEDFQYDNVAQLQTTSYHVKVVPSLEFEHLELNTAATSPLHDVRVRQALQDALDKNALFHAVFPTIPLSSINSYLLHSVIPNASPWSDTSLPLNDYDVSKAKKLLQQAGYATSLGGSGKHLTVQFYTTQTPTRVAIGTALQALWGAVGVKVVTNYPLPSKVGGLFSSWQENGVLHHRKFDVADFAYQISPDPTAYEQNFDPALVPTQASHGALSQNYVGATADQFALLERARYDTDSAQRHSDLNQWQTMIHNDAYWIPLYNRANITADDGTIGNFKPNPTLAGNTWNAYELYAQ